MSTVRQEWFGVSLHPEGSSRSLLTCFPVTFHDHAFRSSHSEETLRYVDPRLIRAHNLILDEGVSPYRAWLQVTNTRESRLPQIMGLNDQQCDRILNPVKGKTEEFSTPHIAVLRFCKEMGIHPAHLQPGIPSEINDFKAQGYDHSVMLAIVELARPKLKKEVADILHVKEIPENDKKIALIACQAEHEKLVKLFSANKAAEFYFGLAMKLASSDSKVVPNSIGVTPGFNYVMGAHQTDIFTGFDLLEKMMEKDFKRSESTLKDSGFRAANLRISLCEYAEVLFGGKNADAVLEFIIQKVKEFKASPELPENYWVYIRDEILEGDTCFDDIIENDEYMSFPSLHPDFEMNANKVSMDVHDVKEEFLDLFEEYMGVHERHTSLLVKHRIVENEQDKFQRWLKHPDTQGQQLPLFLNSVLLKPYVVPGYSKRPVLTVRVPE